MDEDDHFNPQDNKTCSYFVKDFPKVFDILHYFQDHTGSQLDALQLFGGAGNIVNLGMRRGLRGVNIDLQTGMDLNNPFHLKKFWDYIKIGKP